MKLEMAYTYNTLSVSFPGVEIVMLVRAMRSWFRRVGFAAAVLATASLTLGAMPRPAAAQYYGGYGGYGGYPGYGYPYPYYSYYYPYYYPYWYGGYWPVGISVGFGWGWGGWWGGRGCWNCGFRGGFGHAGFHGGGWGGGGFHGGGGFGGHR
jgi:hypothetical protein